MPNYPIIKNSRVQMTLFYLFLLFPCNNNPVLSQWFFFLILRIFCTFVHHRLRILMFPIGLYLFTALGYLLKRKKKLVWHLHNHLLLCITVEKYVIISTTFLFNPYFKYFAVDELSDFIFIVYNFLPSISYFAWKRLHSSNLYH